MWSMVNTNTLNLACCLPPLDSSKSRLVWRNRLPRWPPSNVASSLGHSGPASACPPSTILWERFDREVNGKFHCYMLHHQQKTAEKTLTFGGLIDLCLDPFNQPNSPLEPARNGQGMHLAFSSRSSCECTGYGFWKTREQKYVVQAFLLINRQQPKQGRLQFLTTEELETIFRKRKLHHVGLEFQKNNKLPFPYLDK